MQGRSVPRAAATFLAILGYIILAHDGAYSQVHIKDTVSLSTQSKQIMDANTLTVSFPNGDYLNLTGGRAGCLANFTGTSLIQVNLPPGTYRVDARTNHPGPYTLSISLGDDLIRSQSGTVVCGPNQPCLTTSISGINLYKDYSFAVAGSEIAHGGSNVLTIGGVDGACTDASQWSDSAQIQFQITQGQNLGPLSTYPRTNCRILTRREWTKNLDIQLMAGSRRLETIALRFRQRVTKP
jgi:hypothetical protein